MTIPVINDNKGNKYGDFAFFKKGGMGEIYKGKELKTGNEVILKLVVIETPDDESLLKTEFDVSTIFSHKNIASSLHTGRIEIEKTNYLFMIQQYYPNGNLRTKIAKNMPIDECFRIMLDILEGMKIIHSKIVHRDLKPENILLGLDGNLLITDFGLAKYIDEKTRTRSFKGYGTIPYMAPECWTGDTNTISMDIYSLGIIFYEILVGQLPYNATTEIEWRECHLFSTFPSIANCRAGITIKLDQIIQKMANKRPNQRYKNIDEVIVAINDANALNTKEANEAERLAAIGNIALQNKKAQDLKALQETQKKDEWVKFLNYEITELINKFKEKVSSVNERLEDDKISAIEKQYSPGTTSRKLIVTFGKKSMVVSFGDHDEIENNDKYLKERSLKFQRQQYRMIMQSPEDSFLKANKIVLVGLAETSFKIGDSEFGFNLLLKKIDGSNYGEWQLLQFSENITPPKTKFGINLQGFFENFEKIRHSMFHTMTLRELNDNDIITLLEKILIV